MENEMVDVRDRQLELFDEDATNENLYLVTDAVLTLIERGLIKKSVFDTMTQTVCLEICLPSAVYLTALKDEDVCVDVVEDSAAVGVIRRGTGDTVPVAFSTHFKNFLKKFFRKPL